MKKYISIYKVINYIYKEKGSLGKTYQFFRREWKKNGWSGVKIQWDLYYKQFMIVYNKLNFNKWKSSTEKKVIIACTVHTTYIAHELKRALKQHFDHVDIQAYPVEQKIVQSRLCLYFVICPQAFKSLPELYIAYQMEQTISDRWFDKENLLKLKNAYLVIDYSLKNIAYLQQDIPFSRLYYVPISTVPKDYKEHDYKYDVLFYGDNNNLRRKAFLDEIAKKFNLKIINNVFGNELLNEINNAKIVVNIHYYENALLETTRIFECLSNHVLVISEKGQDHHYYEDKLDPVIDFIEQNDIQGMLERITYWLSHPSEFNARKQLIADFARPTFTEFDFYLNRILLSLDLINFDKFFDISCEYIKPSSHFFCLGLPESIHRQTEFQHELKKYPHIFPFPGLRHSIPWIGCGMSYKYMISYAYRYHWEQISICEDDVLLPDNFALIWPMIRTVLQNQKENWDIFSGCVTDSHPDTRVLDYWYDKQISKKFVRLDKTCGAVFGVYSKSIFSYIIKWDEKNYSPFQNTIDRYIESKNDLKVITTIPFFVSPKKNVKSSIWDNPDIGISYDNMIKKSQRLLTKKVINFQNMSSDFKK